MLAPFMASHQEVTLNIRAPLLEKSGPNKTITIDSADKKFDSEWTVTLTRFDSTLLISVKRNCPDDQVPTTYRSLHIIPWSEYNPILSTPIDDQQLQSRLLVHCKVDAEKVAGAHRYDFGIVLSTDKGLARKLVPPHCKHQELIPLLLKDVTLTDSCFIFSSNVEGRSVCLWAHRSVFSPYKKFLELITEGEKVAYEKRKKLSPTMRNGAFALVAPDLISAVAGAGSTPVRVDNVAMSTFCVLLYYIYMDEVNLKLDTCRMFSGCESIRGCPVDGPQFSVVTLTKVKDEDGHDGVPFPLDVKWEDLMEAAGEYEISDLTQLCQREIIEGLDKTNAVDVLFGKSGRDPEIKEAAIEFIVDSMDAIFEENEDPFDHYRSHPEHHDILVKLMRLKAMQAFFKLRNEFLNYTVKPKIRLLLEPNQDPQESSNSSSEDAGEEVVENDDDDDTEPSAMDKPIIAFYQILLAHVYSPKTKFKTVIERQVEQLFARAASLGITLFPAPGRELSYPTSELLASTTKQLHRSIKMMPPQTS
ncbi:hypothetical protein EC991_005419 [Linnemannia zychae]|nr:hypothetical protein EC991_005419 [Linnemannia zychae]